MMKPLIVTNHALDQYSSRTGRNPMSCVAELINSIRSAKKVEFECIHDVGFNVTRKFKGDTYYIWYDPKVDDDLLAIIAKDGAIKTVLRREMYSYKRKNTKHRYDTMGRCFEYDYESSKKRYSGMR